MPEKLKVLVITERFYPEEFLINELAAGWAAGAFQVDVLTQAPSYPFDRIFPGYTNGLFRKDHWGGLGIYRLFTVLGYKKHLSFKLLHYLLFAILGSVVALCIGRRYDRIFVYQLGPLTDAIPAVLIRKLLRKDMTIWVQDVWPDSVYAYGFKKSRLLSAFLGALVKTVELVNWRKKGLQKVLEGILKYQRDFFLGGPLKPLSQRSFAAELALNPSTVSRLIARRSLKAGDDEVPLKSFFPSKKEHIIAKIKELSDPGGKRKLSARLLADELKKRFGIKVSVRTLNLYRNGK